MTRKTRIALLVGLGLFGAGTLTTIFLGTRSQGGSSGHAARVPVFYAASAVDAGTGGTVAVNGGLIRQKEVDASARPVNAVTDASQLAGGVAASIIPAGTIVTVDMFPAPQTRIGTVVIPPGKRALALQLQPVPGVAGFAGAGDHVDVYGVAQGDDTGPSRVQLVFQSVEVLNVNGLGLPAAQGQADGPGLVYLLAVTPNEAEKLIYLSEFNKLYFDLVAKDEPPVVTPGAGPAEALQGL
ncbi:MAG: pilus assembly protein CpaB [Actinomycetota bacterium]|jgi:Flp pilus assembly protein CpaB|nr:pilus assembly protein CpaB [Actinomycetota bacterium]